MELFRSKTKVEQAETVQDILKAYQDEIDQLSRRSKASESAFNSLYKSLFDCIDPIPVIENLLSVQAQVTPPSPLPGQNDKFLLNSQHRKILKFSVSEVNCLNTISSSSNSRIRMLPFGD